MKQLGTFCEKQTILQEEQYKKAFANFWSKSQKIGQENTCPICEKQDVKPWLMKNLYGTPVCKKCQNLFADKRRIAYVIDFILYGLVFLVLVVLLSMLFRIQSSPLVNFLFYFVWIAISFLFLIKDGTYRGMSLGKLLFGLQVIDIKTENPIGFRQSFLRNLPLLPFLITVPILLISVPIAEGLRWGDRLASTMVICGKLNKCNDERPE